MRKLQQKNTKTLYIESLRCVGLLLVVLIHVVAIPIQNWTKDLSGEYVLYSLAYTFGICGVPLFLMISGALLLNPDKKITTDKLWKKMIPRILLPLCVFGFFFACLEAYFETRTFTAGMILNGIMRVINRESWGHLWYMYMLIGIYIFLPVLKYLANTKTEKMFIYFTIVVVVLGHVIPTINALLGTKVSVNAPLPLCHIGTFWMGYVVTKYKNSKSWNWITDIFGIIAVVVLLLSATISGKFGHGG